MVTRILFDPRRDLADGTSTANPVTITASPTGIAENGAVVIFPTALTFTINTGADLFQLPASVASWAWKVVVRDAATNAVLQQRTVKVPDTASVPYQSLQDVDPASLQPTRGAARQWDATFYGLLGLIPGMVALTQAQYDALTAKSSTTLYLITA